MSADTVEFVHARSRGGKLVYGGYYQDMIKRFCQLNDGKSIWITMIADEIQTAEETACFHGPILDAFVRATGDSNRRMHKGLLKRELLSIPDGKGGTVILKTKGLVKTQYKRLVQGSVEILMDQFHGFLLPKEEKQYIRFREGNRI